MKIVVMRHGKPAVALRQRINAGQLGTWIEAYTLSGVSTFMPPREAFRAARESNIIVTSDLARSIGSAKILYPDGKQIISERLFREATWPFAMVPLLRFRPYAWAALFRVLWFFGYQKNCPEPVTALKQRASLAADRLISLAQSHESVLFVGHGILNTFIVRALRKKGWKGPRFPGYGFWSAVEYVKQL